MYNSTLSIANVDKMWLERMANWFPHTGVMFFIFIFLCYIDIHVLFIVYFTLVTIVGEICIVLLSEIMMLNDSMCIVHLTSL